MRQPNFELTLGQIVEHDPRFQHDAYHFVREALEHTQRMVTKGKEDEVRHVSGQELLEGIRQFALERFGPMTLTVLEEWGVRQCEDFGEIVFNMVEYHLLGKTEQDSREDFKGGYEFHEAFRQPFLPSRPTSSATESRATEVQ
jgi:uncharacterized repeat protein (TIGR04138 family)